MLQEVIQANIEVHSKMANVYNSEPHFSPENIFRVEEKVKSLICGKAEAALDLGCGTGFMMNILKKFFSKVHGVDVTPAMLEQVDLNGDAELKVFEGDTGSFAVDKGSYDLVTAYSFLHHLYDIVPTLKTAFKALKPGGYFYSGLDPNFYYWEALSHLERDGDYDPFVKREIEMVTYKDEDVASHFDVDEETFNKAEYGKNILSGFKEEDLRRQFLDVGFSELIVTYEWFIGQRHLLQERGKSSEATVMHETLEKALPLTRHLFKYVSVIARA